MVITTNASGQGRAPGLYDEQLQRKQQEKALARGGLPGIGSALFNLTPPLVSKPSEKAGRFRTKKKGRAGRRALFNSQL